MIDQPQREDFMSPEVKIEHYYVVPNLGRESNEKILAELARHCGAGPDNIVWIDICGKSKKVEAIEVARSVVDVLEVHKPEFNLGYHVFRAKEGMCAKPYHPFQRGRKRHTAKYRRVRKDLGSKGKFKK